MAETTGLRREERNVAYYRSYIRRKNRWFMALSFTQIPTSTRYEETLCRKQAGVGESQIRLWRGVNDVIRDF